jgi:ATP:ADP antiporter, AAA family
MAKGGAKELLESFKSVQRGERMLTFLLFFWFFITLCAYYVIRPVRSALVLTDFEPTILPWIYMGTALVTGVAVWIFGKLASLPRKKLIGGLLLFFAGAFFLWWWIAGQAQAARDAHSTSWNWTSPVFYVWVDVYSSMAVTIFWMYANDVFPVRSAKRVFGLIGAAGPLGGLTGAYLTSALVKGLGTVNMVLVAAAIYLIAFGIFLGLEKLTGGKSADRGAAEQKFEKKEADLSELPAVLRLIVSQRYLLLLTLVVCFERMVPDFADFIWQSTLNAHFPDKDLYSQFFAKVEFWRNLLAFVATLFFTAFILQRFGPKGALSTVPMWILAWSVVFVLVPMALPVVILLKHGEEGQRHAWFKAGKETLYTVTSRDVIYKVKGYIEMFFYRFSRGIAGLILLVLTVGLGVGLRGVAIAAIPLALIWLYCTWNVGKEFETLEAAAERRDSAARDVAVGGVAPKVT